MMMLLLLGIILQAIFLPFQFWADGAVRYDFIRSVINTGHAEAMKYSAIGPMISAPLALFDKVLGMNILLPRFNLFVFTLAALLTYKILHKHSDRQFLQVFLIILFFGSMFPGHVIHYYGEVLSASFMMLGLALLTTNKTLIAWPLIILSVGNTPATLIPLLLICLYKIIRTKNPSYLLLPIAAIVVLLLDSKLRMPNTRSGFTNYLLDDKGFQTLLPYSGLPGFSYPLYLGILSELFSFGKGLLFFAPGIVFVPYVMRKLNSPVLKQILTLWIIYLLGLILVYGKWWAWYGGWFWGPRFLLFASIPASFALAYTLADKASALMMRFTAYLLTVWSLWIGVNGAVFQQKGLDICTGNNYAQEFLCWYVPEFSVLFHPFTSRVALSPGDRILILLGIGVGIYITFSVLRGYVFRSLNRSRVSGTQ